MRTRVRAASFMAVALTAFTAGSVRGETLTVEAPDSLARAAERIRGIDRATLSGALSAAGLAMPSDVHITLVERTDPRAAAVPGWIVALASGTRDIVIFPDRVLEYPYDSLESVVQHEVAHLALARQSGGAPLPRWFHEGVAVSVDIGWDFSSRLQLLLAMRGEPGIRELSGMFVSNQQADAALAYRLAAALVDDIRRRHGSDVPGRIAARVREGVPFDAAFASTTGESPDAAASRAWASYRRWTSWVSALTSPSMPWAAILILAMVAFAVRVRRRRLLRRAEWDDEI